jgi:hypothetical protein
MALPPKLRNFDQVTEQTDLTVVFMVSTADVQRLSSNPDVEQVSALLDVKMFYTIYGDVPEITEMFQNVSYPGTIVFRGSEMITQESKILEFSEIQMLT